TLQVKNWVREFYANLFAMNGNHPNPVAYVRGMKISLNTTSINEALGLPNPSETELKARELKDNGRWLLDTLVVEELSRPKFGPRVWTDT
ncbi:hypothetical protein HAX54_042151, partial [Datura stramonium]|nr:hypothetical protein [Datura stramonium]